MKEYKNTTKTKMNLFSRIADSIYQQGYEDGQAATPFTDTEEAEKKAYNRGLNDACEAVRKFIDFEDNGGYSPSALREMFGEIPIRSILKHNTAAEALAKIKAYEDKQKQDAEIKVGDEVKDSYGDIGIVTHIWDEDNVIVIYSGKTMMRMRICELYKTGRTFSQIAEVLAELRGDENDE